MKPINEKMVITRITSLEQKACLQENRGPKQVHFVKNGVMHNTSYGDHGKICALYSN